MIDLANCPYCNVKFKKITANHLKKHNIAYIDYLNDYEKDAYYYKFVSEFIWEFYKPSKQKYIEQVYLKDSKNYGWVTKYAMGKRYLEYELIRAEKEAIESSKITKLRNTRPFPFSIADIVKHLRQERTFGIYTEQAKSSFLTFDIDEDNLDLIESIYGSLRCFEIEDCEVLMSYSGNKGYHITIFFDCLMSKLELSKLFKIILRESNLMNIKRTNGADIIEARGITSQGVKLPLSINRKNTVEYREIKDWEDWEKRQIEGKGNYCFLINQYGCEIETLEKIEKMKKISSNKIMKIINDFDKEITFNDNIIDITVTNEFKKLTDEVNLKAIESSTDDINFSIEAKLDKPIEAKNRHNTLLQIAIYNKTKRMSKDDNENFLIEFTSNNSLNHKFGTSIEENIREIKSMIKTIYDSDSADKYLIRNTIKDISFSKSEIVEILSLKEKHLRKLYFIMFVYFKMHGNKDNNQFFLKYEKITELLNINGKAINKELLQLEKQNKIIFIRKGVKDLESLQKRNLANIYELVYKCNKDDSSVKYKLLCGKEVKGSGEVSFVNFEMMCAKTLKKDEIKKYFSNSTQIIKYKHQKLYEVS